MAYAWRRAVRAIAVTSSTTSVAFMANIFSPLMPIKAFGIFAGCIIPMNYLLMIFIFPPAVIFYEDRIAKISCCKRDNNKVEKFEIDIKPLSLFEKIENFFGSTWNNMVHKSRYPILAAFTIWLVIACFFASKIGPLTEEEEFIPKYHPNIRVWTIFSENFTTEVEESNHIVINLAWGLKDINREGDNPWDPNFIGEVVFDEEFNLPKPESQQYLLEMCEVVRSQEIVSLDEPQEEEIFWCWPQTFKDYVISEGLSYPIQNEDTFKSTM
jgi:hypothetical protein